MEYYAVAVWISLEMTTLSIVYSTAHCQVNTFQHHGCVIQETSIYNNRCMLLPKYVCQHVASVRVLEMWLVWDLFRESATNQP